MKKIITTLVVSILSLTSGFSSSYDKIESYAEDFLPLMVVAGLGRAFEECPNLVAEVAKEQNINLNPVRQISLGILGRMKKLSAHQKGMAKITDPKFNDFLALIFKKECLSLNLEVPHVIIGEDKHCTERNEDKIAIECLLKAYPTSLTEAAELLISLESHASKDEL